MLYDLMVLLGIYLIKLKIGSLRNIPTHVFIAASFMMTRMSIGR